MFDEWEFQNRKPAPELRRKEAAGEIHISFPPTFECPERLSALGKAMERDRMLERLRHRINAIYHASTYRAFSPDVRRLFSEVAPFTMTSIARIAALRDGVSYVVRNRIPGAIVECGVWRGGSMMAVAKTLLELGETRPLYLFDTFEGMSKPTERDRDYRGRAASELLKHAHRKKSKIWGFSPVEEVRSNIGATGYDETAVTFVEGRVEDTIPQSAPERIALLRLDTDWYESTRHELEHLYPRLSAGGVMIIDDYGHWRGARQAVEEFIEEDEHPLFLNRIDYTGRICVKVEL